jgi:hypothetical protein
MTKPEPIRLNPIRLETQNNLILDDLIFDPAQSDTIQTKNNPIVDDPISDST